MLKIKEIRTIPTRNERELRLQVDKYLLDDRYSFISSNIPFSNQFLRIKDMKIEDNSSLECVVVTFFDNKYTISIPIGVLNFIHFEKEL